MEQLGPCYTVGLFAGQTASICVMRTEGFDGNGSTVTKIPPDREAMRPQSHAWKENQGSIDLHGFNFEVEQWR